MDFVLMSLTSLLDHFQYISQYYYCQVLYTNLQGLLLLSLVVYHLSMTDIGFIYSYIIYDMKKKTPNTN
jgi:hypothetical protein